MNTYFVTGATGVVGSAVCEQLLGMPDARLILLTRADDDEHLERRIEALARYWAMPRVAFADCVQWVRGDTTLASFGLGATTFSALAAQTTHVIHCAGAVRMNLSIEAARASAVQAAHNVLAYAGEASAAGRLKKVEFVSTVGVAGRQPGCLAEDWLNTSREFHNTYEQAKAEAEGVMESAIANGVPATIHRPSMVVGGAASGKIIHFQVFYHLAEFLCGTRTRGLFPDTGRTQLDLIPSDYVARALVWSSTQRETIGRVLHLCSGPQQALLISAVRAMIQQRFAAAGLPVNRGITLPTGVFRAAAQILTFAAPAKHRRAIAALPAFLDYLAEAQTFANATTSHSLGCAGIATPQMREFLVPVLDYYLARRPDRAVADE